MQRLAAAWALSGPSSAAVAEAPPFDALSAKLDMVLDVLHSWQPEPPPGCSGKRKVAFAPAEIFVFNPDAPPFTPLAGDEMEEELAQSNGTLAVPSENDAMVGPEESDLKATPKKFDSKASLEKVLSMLAPKKSDSTASPVKNVTEPDPKEKAAKAAPEKNQAKAEPRKSDSNDGERNSAASLQPGARVRLAHLQAKPELNGSLGTLMAFVAAKDRWQVQLSDGAKLFRAANLVPCVEEAPPGDPAGGALASPGIREAFRDSDPGIPDDILEAQVANASLFQSQPPIAAMCINFFLPVLSSLRDPWRSRLRKSIEAILDEFALLDTPDVSWIEDQVYYEIEDFRAEC